MKIIEKTYKWNGGFDYRSATNKIVLHHAAAKSCTADDIHSWHLANGWTGIGYHFFVRKDGSVYRGRPENTVGSHAYGANSDSIGICFEGNYQEEKTMPDAQKQAGKEIVQYIKDKYNISRVMRHKDAPGSTSSCPGQYFPFDEIAAGNPEKPNTNKEDRIMVETLMIGNGDSGNAVKSMQGALIAQGYSCGSYGADGICGDKTVEAIRAYQKAKGLSSDGICGPDTWGKLLEV